MLTGPQKALATLIITTLGALSAAVVTYVPDNPEVQHWGQAIAAVLTVLGNTLGVYAIPNKTAPVARTYAAGGIVTPTTGVTFTGNYVPRSSIRPEPAPFDSSNLEAEALAYREGSA